MILFSVGFEPTTSGIRDQSLPIAWLIRTGAFVENKYF